MSKPTNGQTGRGVTGVPGQVETLATLVENRGKRSPPPCPSSGRCRQPSTSISPTISRPIGFEGQEDPNCERDRGPYERGDTGAALLSLWSEHSEQTPEHGNPARERHHNGPATRPTIVRPDDQEAGNEHDSAVHIAVVAILPFQEVKIDQLGRGDGTRSFPSRRSLVASREIMFSSSLFRTRAGDHHQGQPGSPGPASRAPLSISALRSWETS